MSALGGVGSGAAAASGSAKTAPAASTVDALSMSRLESLLSRMFGPAAFGLDATAHLISSPCWEFGEAPRATVNAEQDTTPVTALQTQSVLSPRTVMSLRAAAHVIEWRSFAAVLASGPGTQRT